MTIKGLEIDISILKKNKALKKIHEIWLHIAFWLLIILMPVVTNAPPGMILGKLFFLVTIMNVFNFYIFYLFFLPGFFNNRFNYKLLITALIAIIVFTFIRNWFFSIISENNEFILEKKTRNPFLFIFKEFVNSVLFSLYPVLMGITIRYFKEQKQKIELIKQKKESEMILLRSQINPHFLFNTLNNIYSLVYSKSVDAHKAVMKLSELLRYSLYKADEEKVSLEEEINYLLTYINLELLRIKEKGFIEKRISGDFNGVEIAPLLLLPFVENAFKHCDKNSKTPVIRLNIILVENTLEFSIQNRIEKIKENNYAETGGIGLANVKKRLELQYYGKYELNISTTDADFKANLKIQL